MVHNPDFENIHQELIDRLKNGDRQAQYRIYKLYYRSMYNTSLRIVGIQEDAEDIMQESFLSAFRNISTYKGKVSFGAWLKKIVINKSLDYLKSRHQDVIRIDEHDIELEDEQQYSDSEYEKIPVKEIRDAIQDLPEGYRIVLTLYLLEGYDHEEIAQILNITGSTSRSQYARARQKLIELLRNRLRSKE